MLATISRRNASKNIFALETMVDKEIKSVSMRAIFLICMLFDPIPTGCFEAVNTWREGGSNCLNKCSISFEHGGGGGGLNPSPGEIGLIRISILFVIRPIRATVP